MFVPRSFLIALQFLTVFPVRLKNFPVDKDMGYSLPYYPLVGLLIGLLLVSLSWVGMGMPASLHAVVVLAFWVVLTGTLHLDGLADSADAWIGGLGDCQKTLTIMKDVYCGPTAVVTLIIILLIKFTALEQLITTGNWAAVILAPVFGRTSLVLLFITTSYVRENGLGSQLSSHSPRCMSIVIIVFTMVTALLFIGMTAFWLLSAVAGTFLMLRYLMLRRIGGTTGDTAGALVEITETVVLLTAALME